MLASTFVLALCLVIFAVLKWYGYSAGNITEENSSIFSISDNYCIQALNTLLQHNPPVLNRGCRLTHANLYNGRERVVVLVLLF